MSKSEAAHSFGVSLSSVKRYVAKANQGGSLSPRKHPGPRPKIDELGGYSRPMWRNVQQLRYERTGPLSLERAAGVRVSESTLSSRLLRRRASAQKKDGGCV